MRAIVIAGMMCACDAGPASPKPQPPPPTVAPPPVVPGIADHFDPAIVGEVRAQPIAAGEYALALALEFSSFPSTEMKVSSHVAGTLQLVLSRDGTATACFGLRETNGSAGQRTYQPPEKRRPYSENVITRLEVMTGHWSADGTIQLDRRAVGTCDPASAVAIDPPPSVRCAATDATKVLPTRSLLCEDPSDVLGLGLPLAKPTKVARRPAYERPRGHQLLLAAGGLRVTLEQDGHAASPTIEIKPGGVAMDPDSFKAPHHDSFR